MSPTGADVEAVRGGRQRPGGWGGRGWLIWLRRYVGVLVAGGLIAGVAAGLPSAATMSGVAEAVEQAAEVGAEQVPAFKHVFIVVMENKELDEVLGKSAAPYLNQLGSQYGLALRFHGVAHPSLPNYLALLGGDTFSVTSNCLSCFQQAPNLADQVEASGRSWKGYFESLPAPCHVGDSRDGLYAQKHNPFIYFDAIRLNPDRCARIVPLSELATDLAANQVPDLVWIGPNLDSSTHDRPIPDGDRWLAATLPAVLSSIAFQDNGLLVVTYDEGDSDAACCGRAPGGGKILTVLASPLARRGYRSNTPYDHYSLLRTIEDAWGLERLGHAGDPTTRNLAEFFLPPGAP